MRLNSRPRSLCLAAVFLSLWLSIPVSAGVVFEAKTTYHSRNSGPGESAQMSVEGPNIKMEIQAGESSGAAVDEVIFRGDRRQMIAVDHRNKSYMVMDDTMAEALGGQVQEAMRGLQEQLEGLDPKQREMLEKVMQGGAAGALGGTEPSQRPETEVRKTAERAEHQGYPCVKYEVLRGGETTRELWVTDWSNLPGEKDVEEAFDEMAEFYEELLDSFGEMFGGSDIFGNTSMFEELGRIDGFPVVTREFEGGELESETVLESATARDLDPDAFEPPKGYRLRTMGPQ